MTPIRPLHSEQVRPVAATRYKLNERCAYPGCDKPTESGHHIFGRFPGRHGDSWYIEIEATKDVLPAVTGQCGDGTKPHHGKFEDHTAKIELEDGVYVVYERKKESYEEFRHRTDPPPHGRGQDNEQDEWTRIGPLDPQPGQTRKARRGTPKRDPNAGPVQTVSFKAPKDDPEAAWRIKEKVTTLLERFEDAGHEIGRTVTVERALDYTLLNAGPEDM